MFLPAKIWEVDVVKRDPMYFDCKNLNLTNRALGGGGGGLTIHPPAPHRRIRTKAAEPADLDSILVLSGLKTACKYCSAATRGNAERGIGYSFQLASLWDQFALHALTNCHLCKNRSGAGEWLSTNGASIALLVQKSGVAQRKRVGLITQRSEDRNLPPLLLEIGPQPVRAIPRWCSW